MIMNEDEMRSWLVAVAANGRSAQERATAQAVLIELVARAATIERVRTMAAETLRLCQESGVPEFAAHLSPRAVLAALGDGPAGRDQYVSSS